MHESAKAGGKPASIWFWVGGLTVGLVVVAGVTLAAAAAVVVLELRNGDDTVGVAGSEVPKVRSAVEALVMPIDPNAEIEETTACGPSHHPQVEAVIAVEPGQAAFVAADLERAAARSGWEPSADPYAPQQQVEQYFDGIPFDFQAIPQQTSSKAEAVLVRARYTGPRGCD